jgi:hypothetical protein
LRTQQEACCMIRSFVRYFRRSTRRSTIIASTPDRTRRLATMAYAKRVHVLLRRYISSRLPLKQYTFTSSYTHFSPHCTMTARTTQDAMPKSEKRLAFSGKVLIPLWTLTIMSILCNIIGYCFKLNECATEKYCFYDDRRGK